MVSKNPTTAITASIGIASSGQTNSGRLRHQLHAINTSTTNPTTFLECPTMSVVHGCLPELLQDNATVL